MRILVVEDEVDLAHTLHTGLTAEGYSVDLAHDGRQGLWMARTG
ncbi:response regulator transcription factor, partial [Streptomyces ardesiacus]